MKLDKVVAGYHKKIVVRDVDLLASPGEIIGIIGPNGGGKSTILKSINGSLSLIGGSVLLDDLDVSKALPKEISKVMSVVTTERVKPILMTCRDVVSAGRIPFTDGLGRLREEDNAQMLAVLRHLGMGMLILGILLIIVLKWRRKKEEQAMNWSDLSDSLNKP